MRLRDAKKLHNGDEVTIKDTGETVIVLNAYGDRGWSLTPDIGTWFIEANTNDGFCVLTHLEVS